MQEKYQNIIVYSTLMLVGVIVGSLLVLFLKPEKDRGSGDDDLSKHLIESPGTPMSAWDRVLDKETTDSSIRVTNHYDKYSLLVPVESEVPNVAYAKDGLQTYYEGESEGILLLDILTFNNPKNIPLEEWLHVAPQNALVALKGSKLKQHNIGVPALYSSQPLISEAPNPQGIIEKTPIANTLEEVYLIGGGNRKAYLITCTALSQANTLIPKCREWLNTFKILE